MLLSLSWLREFVPYEGTAEALGAKLTMLGLELDGLSRPFAALYPIVVGHVVECGRHPEADKLSVCRVDIGSEVLDIVCGAPNVDKGQKVPVITVGDSLPGGLVIKAATLRGAPSHGMICSERELGLSDDHDGILVLDPATPVGAKLVDVLLLDDTVLDISVTPNRGDCLSVLGLARETAAAFGLPLTLPAPDLTESGPDVANDVRLDVPDAALCSLYQGRIIEGAATAKSPAALRYRLQSIGVRAISNLVDVTNYILMELGQPLHAFDLDTVRGGTIRVRPADPGEVLTTLDGQDRSLVPGDIVIGDAQRAIGLGGVMGGLNSEITADSRRVFLECAIFNPTLIRKTARRLSLHSEAAYRFERGVDQVGAAYALDRAAGMMARLSGGFVRPGLIKAEPAPWKAPVVTLRKARAETLLGIPLEDDFCVNTLTALGCSVSNAPSDAPLDARSSSTPGSAVWTLTMPSHRPDLTREADLIEEIARIYGVDRIPPVLPTPLRPLEQAGAPEAAHNFRSRVKHWARGLGLNEAVNYSFVSHKDLDHLGLPAEGRISIMNPLSDEQNALRTRLAPGLLHSLRVNLSQGATGVRLFETAAAFSADTNSPTTAREEQRLGILLCGSRFDSAWPQIQADLDYQDCKGIVENLLAFLRLPAATLSTTSDSGSSAVDSSLPYLAPCVAIHLKDRYLGALGRVKPALADAFHAKKPVWLAELDLDALYDLALAAVPRFAALPVFPPVRRDITVIAAPSVSVAAVITAIADLRQPLLEDVRLIDCFEPKGQAERNLTFRLTFRSQDRTLKDAEVDKQREAVAAALPKALSVKV